jgi:hypothetical protein
MMAAVFDVEFRPELLPDKLSGRDFLIADIKGMRILTQVVHKTVVERCFTLFPHFTKNTVGPDLLHEGCYNLPFLLSYPDLFLAPPSHTNLPTAPWISQFPS